MMKTAFFDHLEAFGSDKKKSRQSAPRHLGQAKQQDQKPNSNAHELDMSVTRINMSVVTLG